MIESSTAPTIAPGATEPPLSFAQDCLFLDFDGTLIEIAEDPQAIRVDTTVPQLLIELHERLGGALAIVSGRPIADLDRHLAPLRLPSAGLHGVELRHRENGEVTGGLSEQQLAALERELDEARGALQELARSQRGLLIEDKRVTLALHYRAVPEAKPQAEELMLSLSRRLQRFDLLHGKCVLELKPAGPTKGTAVEAMLGVAPFMERRPVFVGDDWTDVDGFYFVERSGGEAIAVGERVSARWRLPNPAAVRAWLRRRLDARGEAAGDASQGTRTAAVAAATASIGEAAGRAGGSGISVPANNLGTGHHDAGDEARRGDASR